MREAQRDLLDTPVIGAWQLARVIGDYLPTLDLGF